MLLCSTHIINCLTTCEKGQVVMVNSLSKQLHSVYQIERLSMLRQYTNSLRELFLGEIKNAAIFMVVIFSESSVASFEDSK